MFDITPETYRVFLRWKDTPMPLQDAQVVTVMLQKKNQCKVDRIDFWGNNILYSLFFFQFHKGHDIIKKQDYKHDWEETHMNTGRSHTVHRRLKWILFKKQGTWQEHTLDGALQDTTAGHHTWTHTCTHLRGNLEWSVYLLACFGKVKKIWVPGKNPHRHAKNM